MGKDKDTNFGENSNLFVFNVNGEVTKEQIRDHMKEKQNIKLYT